MKGALTKTDEGRMVKLVGHPSAEDLPPGWVVEWPMARDPESFGTLEKWRNEKRGMTVIASYAKYEDGRIWLHVSLARKGRIPTYEDLAYVKRHWIGEDRKAVMVLPSKDRHVNIHPRCLHLFYCPGGDGLPEFSGYLRAVGRTI